MSELSLPDWDLQFLRSMSEAPDHHLDKSLTDELKVLLNSEPLSVEVITQWAGKARDFAVRHALASSAGLLLLQILAEKYPESIEARDRRRAEIEASGG